jgi:hypothetical protein
LVVVVFVPVFVSVLNAVFVACAGHPPGTKTKTFSEDAYM